LLGGEPGIGKTRLALEVARGAHGDGAVVLAGRCDEDLGVPYQPFVEALRHFVQATPGPEPAWRLGRHPGELVRLVPELADAVPGLPPALRSDPETERYRLFDAVASWLAAVSAEAPVLLVLDDLHWAAKPTLLLLRHVLRFAEPLRLLVVATYRDTELGRRHPLADLLADLRRQPGVERISVSGLDAAGVTAFIEQVAGHRLEDDDEAFTRAIYSETEGNPFFVSEVLRHLAESGGVERRHGRWVPTSPIDELGIPEGIRDVVSRRLSRLSDEANDVLAVAAALGLDFEPALLQQAGGLSEDTVVATLEEAVSARLVREVPGPAPSYRFSHALVRGTLYDELSAARRVAVHRKLADAIEIVHAGRLDEHLPALAYHYAQASVPAAEPGKAVEYARRAGAAALTRLAHDDAVRYYRQALELLDAHGAPAGDPRRVDVLIALGEGQRRSGDPAYRETLFEAARRARERGDSDALARAALANSRGSLAGDAGRLDTELLAVLEGALEATGEADSAARARLMAHIALEQAWTGDQEELVRLDDSALAMARRLDDTTVLADVLLSGFYAIHSPSTLTERLERAADVLALAEQLEDGRMMLHAYWHGARAAMEGGDIAEARRCVQHQERLAADLGEPTLRWMAAISGVGLPLAAGRVAEAEARNEAALAMGQGTQPDAPTFYASQLFPIRYTQGLLVEVEEMFRTLVEDPEFPVPAAEAITALIYCDTDRLEEARRFYEPLAATGFSRMRFDALWVVGLSACAEVCVGLGDTGSAGVLRRLLLPYSDRLATILNSALNSVSHYLGMLDGCAGRYDDAETWFATAVAGHDRLGTPAWLARTRLEWARMLLTRQEAGDVQRARELLDQALAGARELGLGSIERRAVALLEATPGR
ncbi:MAG: ATP-binding protein, partial [Acidimicrobiia bacterium]